MKFLAAVCSCIFIILLGFYILLQAYIRPVPAGEPYDAIRVSVDCTIRSAWIQRAAWARLLFRTVFRNSDKIVFFPPRIIVRYDYKGRTIGYISYGRVVAWDWQQRLLTVSSYIGNVFSVRFDPSAYEQTAILAALDQYGGVVESKPVQMVRRLPVPNMETLFCPDDVLEITTRTYQELRSASPANPLVPSQLVLSFRLCQNAQ
jgi:hypothetical protein